MTALSLYDVLARGPGNEEPSELVDLLEALSTSAIEDLRRIEHYEERFLTASDRSDETELELLRSIWRLYDSWAQETEQLLERTHKLAAAGKQVASAGTLEDEYGWVRARLGLTPERIMHSRRQAREGQLIPAKELRDELNARLHA
jgi:hypothetical protein